MSVGLFMDEHIPSLITKALRASGADVITVQEDGARPIHRCWTAPAFWDAW